MHIPLMMAGLRLIEKCVTAYVDAEKAEAAPAVASHASTLATETITITWYAVPDAALASFMNGRKGLTDPKRWLRLLEEDGRVGDYLPTLRAEYAEMRRHYPGMTIFVTVRE
jgi:hypothetical protein